MGKYDQLRSHLTTDGRHHIELSFDEIERVVGGLPLSAREHRAWWANEVQGSHVQADAWLGAGYRVDAVDQVGRRVRFVRSALGASASRSVPPTAPPRAPPTIPRRDPTQTWQTRTKLSYFRYLHSSEGKAEYQLGFPWVSVIIAGVLFLSIVAIPAGIGHAIGIMIRQSMRKKKFVQAVALAKRCEPLFVYPIMVNTRLRQFPNQRAPGLVMGSFDDVGEEYFTTLATVLQSISQAAPADLAPAEAALRQALTDEQFVPDRRRRIPDELTGGVPVYLFDLMIDGRRLVGGRLMTTRILCLADRGDRGMIFNIPYHTIDVPIDEPPNSSSERRVSDDPRICDECFALVDCMSAPIGPDHPIHSVVDDIGVPCPRCCAPLVSLLTLRLEAPELNSIATKLPTPGLPILRVVVCEHCCVECLHTIAAYGPRGELIPDSIRVRDEPNGPRFPTLGRHVPLFSETALDARRPSP